MSFFPSLFFPFYYFFFFLRNFLKVSFPNFSLIFIFFFPTVVGYPLHKYVLLHHRGAVLDLRGWGSGPWSITIRPPPSWPGGMSYLAPKQLSSVGEAIARAPSPPGTRHCRNPSPRDSYP
jgi:hypothetical protein